MYIEEVKVDIENFDEIKSIFNDLYNVTAKYYPLNNLLILKGEKNNVEQAKNFLSEYNLEKEVKLFNVPFSENIKVIIESVIPDSKVYDLNGKLLVFGDKNMFDEVEDLLMNVNQNNSIVEINTDIDNLEEFVKFNFGNKIEILRLNGKIFAKGNLNDLNVLKEKLRSFEQSFVSVENGKININVKDYNLKNLIDKIFSKFNLDIIFESEINKHVTLNVAEITLDDFINFLNEQGVNVRRKENIMYFNDNTKKIMVKNGLITINATNATIVEISRNVYPKFGYAVIVDSVDDDLNIVLNNATLKEFENILLKKVDITKEGSLVYIKPKGKVEEKNNVVEFKDGKFNINAENVSLREVIRQVVKGYGYSAVISKDINTLANLYVNDLNFDSFEKILNNYNIEVKKEDGIYVFDLLTSEGTKTINTFTFSVPKNVEKIQKLIEFYGGNSFVDSAAGVVIATGIDAKIAGEIRNYIEKYLNSKLALIEVRVVDEEFTNSLDLTLGELTSNIGNLSKDGFDITLTLGEMSLEKIVEKLLSVGTVNELTLKLNGKINATDKDTKILASPNVVAKSGEKASILIGDKIPIVLTTAENTQEIKYIESGVTLEITPFVNADNTIDLELNIKVSSFDWDVKNVYGLTLPLERTREFNSKISLKENETLIIGGLTREENSKTESKVPILGDLPIIGKFFKTEKNDLVKRNIIILISAKVVE